MDFTCSGMRSIFMLVCNASFCSLLSNDKLICLLSESNCDFKSFNSGSFLKVVVITSFNTGKSFTPSELNDIDTKYITYQTLRSSGAGGQHVNKTETAVRAIHAPTGLSVTASDQRSQHQNKKLATERLLIKLSAWNEEQATQKVQENRDNHNNLERGNPVKVINEPLMT